MKSITVDGVHGSGKTELISKLRSHYEKTGRSVYVVEEAARDCPHAFGTVQAERWIWYEHWQREIDAMNSGADTMLCDRSVLGNLVYFRYVLDHNPIGYGEDAFKFFSPIAKLHMLKYDHVVLLPLNESYILNSDDANRSKDLVYARVIDSMFGDIVGEYVNTEVADLFWCD